MPRKAQGWITFQSSDEERQILEQVCQQTQRTKTEVLREMLRTMGPAGGQAGGQAGAAIATSTPTDELADLEAESDPELPIAQETTGRQSLKISARNILKAQVKQIVKGTVSAEVTLVIAPGIELVSVITRSSADTLKLENGKSVFAVIKSNNVMLAEA
jgi:molybdopterin-binding protein